MAEQRRVRITGNVQGVGFRYTAVRIAAGFDITGWVRNTADGSVEIIVEGESKELTAFLSELQNRMAHYIRQMQVQKAPATGQFTGFTVNY